MSVSALPAQNYEKVLDGLENACRKAGRKREEITLVAVSKFHSANDIESVAAKGQLDFGENYLQEADEKKRILSAYKDLRWHMIGHVQSRKASGVAGNFLLVHTLDSIKLANAMEKALLEKELVQEVLIEVNIGEEAQKAGVNIKDLHNLAEHVEKFCPHLKIKGLMCLPPVFDAGEAARPYFAKLFQLREGLSRSLGRSLPDLSMGMSGDYEAAIAEGATIVRIGTDIFGPRPLKAK